jgi:CshA-type fibril repeat protein
VKSLRKLSTGAVGVVLAASSIVIPVGAASAAAADPAGPVACNPESGYTDCARFTYAGGDETFTVPDGVTALRVKAWGAGGGGSEPSPWNENATGGGGGFTTGSVPVTTGQILTLMVGQGGGSTSVSASYGGGAAAGHGWGFMGIGGAGGGMSAVWVDQAHTVPLLIAGGGGGAGGSSDYPVPEPGQSGGGGGGGGLNGGTPADLTGNGGSGASQEDGGSGGWTQQSGPGCELPGNSGTQFSGGAGADAFDPQFGAGGGGGGGGYYGGGGGGCGSDYLVEFGAQGGAGGGGSGFVGESVTDADTTAGDNGSMIGSAAVSGGQYDPLYNQGTGIGSTGFDPSGNGEIVIEWVAGPQPVALTSTGTGTASQSVTATIPDGGSFTLLDGTTPTDTVTVAGQGTYTLNEGTGVITFAPVAGFTGAATPVNYRVTDSSERTGDATYTPTVNAPDAPTPTPLTSSGTGTASQSVTATIPDGGSITLLDGTTPTDTVTVSGRGTYTLNEGTGVITFAPVVGFSGAATAVTYQVTDSYQSTGSSTYTPTVNVPDAPSPTPVATSGKAGTVQHAQVPVPSGGSVMLLNGPTPVATVAVPSQGAYSVDPESGMLTFTPAAGFIGTAHSVTYRVTDAYGIHGDATYTAKVLPSGVATASAPALVTLPNAASTVPVTCKVSVGNVARCDVTLLYRIKGNLNVLGTGSVVVPGAGTPHQVVVPVKLNALGHLLAGALGGVPAALSVSLKQVGNPTAMPAATTTKFVNATVNAPQAVYFDSGSATLRPGDATYLKSLSSKLSGVRSITCTGNTDNSAGWFANWLLGAARAAAACNYLTEGTAIRHTLVTNGLANPAYSNATAFGRQLNRRTDIQFKY